MILLDSDVLIDVSRLKPTASAWIKSVSPVPIVLPGFVVMEFLKGCRDARELKLADTWLATFRRAWPDGPTCEAAIATYAAIKLSSGIGIIDCLIAYTAISLGLPLHTFNTRHYAAVPGLQTVQPYVR